MNNIFINKIDLGVQKIVHYQFALICSALAIITKEVFHSIIMPWVHKCFPESLNHQFAYLS